MEDLEKPDRPGRDAAASSARAEDKPRRKAAASSAGVEDKPRRNAASPRTPTGLPLGDPLYLAAAA